MKELVLEILKKMGYEEGEFEYKGVEVLPILRYKVEDNKVKIFIFPSKDVYIFDLLESLRKYFDFSIIFRGFTRDEIENASFEEGERSFICYYRGEEVIRGKERIYPRIGKPYFEIEIDMDKIEPKMKKILVVLKGVKYSEVRELIRKAREKNIIVVDEGRRFEKAKVVGEKGKYDYVVLIDKFSLITKDARVYDAKMRREKVRNLSEIFDL